MIKPSTVDSAGADAPKPKKPRAPRRKSLASPDPEATPVEVEMKIGYPEVVMNAQRLDADDPRLKMIGEQISQQITRDFENRIYGVVQSVYEGGIVRPNQPVFLAGTSVEEVKPVVVQPVVNDLSNYTFDGNPSHTVIGAEGVKYINVTKDENDVVYIGEAERVTREEEEAKVAKTASEDGYFTSKIPASMGPWVEDPRPYERQKFILALAVGVLTLLGLSALATIAFFGEIPKL